MDITGYAQPLTLPIFVRRFLLSKEMIFMNFNRHPSLEGRHALLSASKYSWINDSEEQVLERVSRTYLAELGTDIHDIARKRIKYSVRLKKSDKDSVIVDLLDMGIPRMVINSVDFDFIFSNLLTYVNDCIGFRMVPEVVLAYSDICFGTADAIRFDEKQKLLRIHDLKTGSMSAHIEQLLIYAALFFLEYREKPVDIHTELRIYQSNDIRVCEPTAEDIVPVMDKIKTFDKLIRDRKD